MMVVVALLVLVLLTVSVLLVTLLVWGPKRFLQNMELVRNLGDLVHLLAALKLKARAVRDIDWSAVDMFEEAVAQHGSSPAISMVDPQQTVTYAELDERANRVAHWGRAQGLSKGDSIALVMNSCPDYVAVWIGMAKIGVCTGLINTHIKGTPLLHAVREVLSTSQRKIVVAGSGLAERVASGGLLSELGEDVRVWALGGACEGALDLDVALLDAPKVAVPRNLRDGIRWNHTLFLVFTSGTTGLPKASKITHLRFFSAAALFAISAGLSHEDRVYCALPLYHSAGGMLGVGGCWWSGGCLVVRSRFSVTNFAQDCVIHRCTVVQYIGEVARYLANAPPCDLDRQCRVRVAFGNGMRADVWVKFQRRYNVGKVVEFYASTEGNVNIVNTPGRVGAVGVVPWFASRVYPVKLLRVDPESYEPVRDPRTGLCVLCAPGEPGQLVGLINNHDPARRFDGYTDEKATAKKLVQDVCKKGDRYFASGDLLRQDSFGFFYWVDRIGDTYRWKGENVATTEVAQILGQAPNIADVNVYGVEVPGQEGRAGMAAIQLTDGHTADSYDWQALYKHVDDNLPVYAQPLFVRVQREQALTATFKHQKSELRQQGFDPQKVGGDALFFRDKSQRCFVSLDSELYSGIVNGTNPV